MLNYSLLYAEHLSDGDLEVIARVAGAGRRGQALRAYLRRNPEEVERYLASRGLFEALFGEAAEGLETAVSPFLTFGVLVNRSAQDLRETSHVSEFVGAGRRLPVFDAASLGEFVEEATRRYFLIEFLASFTRVASGSMWVPTRRGYRRLRYSEMDPVRMVELVDRMPPEHRPAGYRRLGDVALFLSGVFPDYTAGNPLGLVERQLLARSAGLDPEAVLEEGDQVGFLEAAGTNWYHRAVEVAHAVVGTGPEHLRDVADNFTAARRFLNFLTDRYLFRFETGIARPGSG
ncbi:MAG: hypothetical protein ACE5F5_08280 [Acidimicrobiia bacterium]